MSDERLRPMVFPDLTRSQKTRVRKTDCHGGPECLCPTVRIYTERPYRVEVKCERELPDKG